MQRYIADSNSALLGLQPEDWLEMASRSTFRAPASVQELAA
jgi:4-alpha-glucanotransferase